MSGAGLSYPQHPGVIPQQPLATATSASQNRRNVLDFVQRLPLDQRKKFVCVSSQWRRKSLSEPWGVALSMFENRVLLGRTPAHSTISGNNRNTTNGGTGTSILQWCYALPCRDIVPPPELVFLPPLLAGGSTLLYGHNLQHFHHRLVHTTANPVPSQILPGDLIVAVDGMDPAVFQDLTRFTNYLRQVTHCTVVILRHVDATTAALIPWRRQAQTAIPPNLPVQAALASDFMWRRILASPQSLPHMTTPQVHPIARQVTPDSESLNQISSSATALWNGASFLKRPTPKPKKVPKSIPPVPLPEPWKNPWFQGKDGKDLPFVDNWEYSPEDGLRSKMFLPPISDFQDWLTKRKRTWKSKYQVYRYAPENSDEEFESEECTVPQDFWTQQGFASFDEWRVTSVAKWNVSYSWNKRKRQKIQRQREEVVHISTVPEKFDHWLNIRRNQWRLLRRKRQRERAKQAPQAVKNEAEAVSCVAGQATSGTSMHSAEESTTAKRRKLLVTPAVQEIAAIDMILEQEDLERKQRLKARALFDISFLFDSSKGAPDDVVVHCLEFLANKEYAKLLRINKGTSTALKAREEVWRQLCPSHWVLPRRPRKPWHELYFHKLRIELRDSQKLWDDLMVKCSTILDKGDHIQKIEKLVVKGEKDFGFDVNYVSPVVCERNSLLNLAVIHQRHKVVRWLLDHRHPDIESYDRGHFTPLLNAAWAGDRQLVRLLLQRGANRTKIGFGHYSKALAHPDFKGLTAEGWALKRGHEDIAKLIRLGL